MSDVAVRLIRPEDYEQIERLKRPYDWLGSYTREDWLRLYERNPLLRTRALDWPWGWALESDGRLLGHLGNVPLEYAFGDRSLVAAAASNWVVDPAARGHSLQLVLHFFRQTQADLLDRKSVV